MSVSSLKALILLILYLGCNNLIGTEDSSPEPEESQTRILKIIVEPDTVSVNDQIKITCLISDSLNTSFNFNWILQGYNQTIVTDTNSIIIRALGSGLISNVVRVDNGAYNKKSVSRSFNYFVE